MFSKAKSEASFQNQSLSPTAANNCNHLVKTNQYQTSSEFSALLYPNVYSARAERQLITLLTDNCVDLGVRFEQAKALRDKFNIEGESLRRVVSHVLEIASIQNDSKLIAQIHKSKQFETECLTTFYSNPKRIGGCSSSDVYNISDYLVIKVARNRKDNADLKYIWNEKQILCRLFELGISVPRPVTPPVMRFNHLGFLPREIREVFSALELPSTADIIIMERLYGEQVFSPAELARSSVRFARSRVQQESELRHNLAIGNSEEILTHPAYLHAQRVDLLREAEYERCIKSGLVIYDDQWHNSIYVRELDQLFIIDTAWWKYKNPLRQAAQDLYLEARWGLRFWTGC